MCRKMKEVEEEKEGVGGKGRERGREGGRERGRERERERGREGGGERGGGEVTRHRCTYMYTIII